MSMSPARYHFSSGSAKIGHPASVMQVPYRQGVDLNLGLIHWPKRALKETVARDLPLIDLVDIRCALPRTRWPEIPPQARHGGGKTDEVAPKTARCLVIGDGKFRNKPGFVAHGLTLAGTDGTMVDRCTVRQRRDALRISQSAPAKSAMKSRAPIRIATMLMATCA